MRAPGDVERLVALARSLELGPEDLAKALDALEEDLAGGEGELAEAEVKRAKAAGLQGLLAFLLEHSAGPRRGREAAGVLGRGGGRGRLSSRPGPAFPAGMLARVSRGIAGAGVPGRRFGRLVGGRRAREQFTRRFTGSPDAALFVPVAAAGRAGRQ